MLNVFLLAHQDDEFGVFHQIETLAAAKKPLAVFYLTDGAFGAVSAQTRNAESRKALGKLGVLPHQIYFLGEELGIANQTLHLSLEKAWLALKERIALLGNPEIIYSLAWEGGHPDHDATCMLAAALASAFDVPVYQFPLYNAYNTRVLPFRVLSAAGHHADGKKTHIPRTRWLKHFRLCCSYPSQAKTWAVLLPFVVMHYLRHGVQTFIPLTGHAFSQRPHQGQLLYERRRWLTYDEFTAKTQEFRNNHIKI